MTKLKSPQELEALRKSLLARRDPKKPCIAICNGTGCQAYGAVDLASAFKDEVKKQGLAGKVEVKTTGCRGFCERGTIVTFQPQNYFYQQVKVKDVPQIVSETAAQGKVLENLLYSHPRTGEKFATESEIPFYSKQHRLLLSNNSLIDPANIEDYIALGGYSALAKALYHMKPEAIIQEVKASGLRGRGGGGFPTGVKWETCRHAKGDIKYVICNADEGDPGAYMDRSVMEGNPHSVLEGMLIGAFAIGSNEGYVYIRYEYPLALHHLTIALRQAEEHGLLGKNILGSGFDFSVRINRGGGAFICGESTALMASLEGKVGEPRAKYVHTVEKGLWDRPSNLNNVETWANVPLIINNGAKWYNQIGTKGSKGTKIFSLVGKINNTGLVEVPMGITLREIIYDIGGGIPRGKKFKAVQTGGPSGGCLPESLLDLPVDYDELDKAGSMMGSGGMIVMDEDSCMVDVARYFITFLEEESCGKCAPCREGLKRLREIFDRITGGEGHESDLDLIKQLCDCLLDGSLCALGTTAPNPVLTTMRYFAEEYRAHIVDKKCSAGVCKALITFSISEKCPGCGLCVKACPTGAITLQGKKEPAILDQSKCIKCRSCYDVCRLGAVIIK